jgi:hypothetical protein
MIMNGLICPRLNAGECSDEIEHGHGAWLATFVIPFIRSASRSSGIGPEPLTTSSILTSDEGLDNKTDR